MTPERTPSARELLAFYLEAGADALLGEAAVDRFADQDPPRAASSPSAPAAARVPPSMATPREPTASRTEPTVPPPAPLPPEAAVTDARAQARQAKSLDELRRILDGF